MVKSPCTLKSKKRRANQAEGPSWEDSLSLSGTYLQVNSVAFEDLKASVPNEGAKVLPGVRACP